MAAFYVTLENSSADLPGTQSGASIVENLDALEAAIDDLSLPSVYEFVSQSPAEYEELMDEFQDDSVTTELGQVDMKKLSETEEFQDMMRSVADSPGFAELMGKIQQSDNLQDFIRQVLPEQAPEEEWFDPADGISQIEVLLEHVQKNQDNFVSGPALVRDMEKILEDLHKAQKAGSKFHYTLNS